MSTALLILYLVIGGLCVFTGWYIWKKKNILLPQVRQIKSIRPKAVESYSKEMGESIVMLGLSIWLSALCNIVFPGLGWLIFMCGFAYAFIRMDKAQKKFNSSW